ncbi:MAG TPA: hypothetical protein VKA54_21090 [Gemmatimonadaceae bacterium]|nr:hypothetical protein [Gemmatimonadaceae bacterium]
MDDERLPETEPSGALVPPPVHPPTALATAAPLPPRRWDDDVVEARGVVARLVTRTLDALDNVGDSIAAAVGLR